MSIDLLRLDAMLNDTVRVYLTMIKRLMNYKESKTPDCISSGCVVMKKYSCLLRIRTPYGKVLDRNKKENRYAFANSFLFKGRVGNRFLIAFL